MMPPRFPALALSRGFTLIELMVVIAMIAIATAGVTFAFRDNESSLLDREADRISVILETVRVQSRSSGVAMAWLPLPEGFVVLPARALVGGQIQINTSNLNPWLAPGITAQILGKAATAASTSSASANVVFGTPQHSLLLGAEPMIAPVAVMLSLGERRLQVATDGLRPFAVQSANGVGEESRP